MPKKIIPLIFLLLFAVGCDKKKERIANNTMSLAIDPPQTQAVAYGSQMPLKAVASNARGNVDVNPTWSVENNMGTFNPAQGKETTFIAGNSSGTAKIYACYGNVRAETTVTIGEKNSGGGTGGGTGGNTGGGGNTGRQFGGLCGIENSSYFGLLSETMNLPGILLDTDSSRFPAAGCMGVWPDGELTVLTDAMGPNDTTEGLKALKCTIGSSAGGWWMQFGSDAIPGLSECDFMEPIDLSMFTGGSLKFDIKTTKDVMVAMKWGNPLPNGSMPGADVTMRELGVPLDGQWHSVSIPLSNFRGIDLKKMKVPVSFSSAPGCVRFSFIVDNVRWEKHS